MRTLEDHAGDVVRKSRMGLNISREQTAEALGLSLDALDVWESDGVLPAGEHDFTALSELLDLDAGKLHGVQNGWVPEPVTSPFSHVLHTIETDDGGMAVNAFLLWDSDSKEAVLFDTGWNFSPIESFIHKHDLQLSHLFITHQHGDHVAALDSIVQKCPSLPILSFGKGIKTTQPVAGGEVFQVGGLEINAHLTPGHAIDGVTYIVRSQQYPGDTIAVVGDALFAGSMGGAPKHFQLAKQKVRDVILRLPEETVLCPGHGPLSTVREEKSHNPFF